MNKLEDVMLGVVICISIFLIGLMGWTLSERSHCFKNGGVYSFDYGACVKGVRVVND